MKKIVIFLILSVFLISCGKKDKPKEIIVIGSDTLTIETIKEIKSGDTSNIVNRNCFLYSASKKANIVVEDKSLFYDFKDRLELESGEIWNEKGAELLFKTAKYFKTSLLKEPDGLKDLFNDINAQIDEKYRLLFQDKLIQNIPENSDSGYSRKDMEILMGRLFLLNKKAEKVVGDFIYVSDEVNEKGPDVSKMVSGLVFDSNSVKKETKKSPNTKSKKSVVDNSKYLIKYRSLSSIKDSISKHSINIQSIYKKTLKIHEGINGVVYVKFRVDESGGVVEVNISRSEINNKELHENLMSYVRNIKFKAIPEGKGLMTFDFPFEFRPE